MNKIRNLLLLDSKIRKIPQKYTRCDNRNGKQINQFQSISADLVAVFCSIRKRQLSTIRWNEGKKKKKKKRKEKNFLSEIRNRRSVASSSTSDSTHNQKSIESVTDSISEFSVIVSIMNLSFTCDRRSFNRSFFPPFYLTSPFCYLISVWIRLS